MLNMPNYKEFRYFIIIKMAELEIPVKQSEVEKKQKQKAPTNKTVLNQYASQSQNITQQDFQRFLYKIYQSKCKFGQFFPPTKQIQFNFEMGSMEEITKIALQKACTIHSNFINQEIVTIKNGGTFDNYWNINADSFEGFIYEYPVWHSIENGNKIEMRKEKYIKNQNTFFCFKIFLTFTHFCSLLDCSDQFYKMLEIYYQFFYLRLWKVAHESLKDRRKISSEKDKSWILDHSKIDRIIEKIKEKMNCAILITILPFQNFSDASQSIRYIQKHFSFLVKPYERQLKIFKQTLQLLMANENHGEDFDFDYDQELAQYYEQREKYSKKLLQEIGLLTQNVKIIQNKIEKEFLSEAENQRKLKDPTKKSLAQSTTTIRYQKFTFKQEGRSDCIEDIYQQFKDNLQIKYKKKMDCIKNHEGQLDIQDNFHEYLRRQMNFRDEEQSESNDQTYLQRLDQLEKQKKKKKKKRNKKKKKKISEPTNHTNLEDFIRQQQELEPSLTKIESTKSCIASLSKNNDFSPLEKEIVQMLRNFKLKQNRTRCFEISEEQLNAMRQRQIFNRVQPISGKKSISLQKAPVPAKKKKKS